MGSGFTKIDGDVQQAIKTAQQGLSEAVAGAFKLGQNLSQLFKQYRELERLLQGGLTGLPMEAKDLKQLKPFAQGLEQNEKTLNEQNNDYQELMKLDLRKAQTLGFPLEGPSKDQAQKVKENLDSKLKAASAEALSLKEAMKSQQQPVNQVEAQEENKVASTRKFGPK